MSTYEGETPLHVRSEGGQAVRVTQRAGKQYTKKLFFVIKRPCNITNVTF